MIRSLIFTFSFLFCVLWESIFPPASFGETIRLRQGFQHIIEFQDARRVSIGNPEIIEARPLPHNDGILVVGKKEGETDLVLWRNNDKREWIVHVVGETNPLAEETRNLAAIFPGLSVTQVGSSIMITGTVPTTRDRKFLETFARTRHGIHLRISLPEEKKTLLSYDLKMIEISRGATTHLGVRWPDSFPAKGAWSYGSRENTSFGIASEFEARLNILMADGRAKILANPKLVCESGEKAEFLAGGEIPIVIITPETRSVEWKTYGIILRLEPIMDHDHRIRTQLTAEISTVDHGSGGSDVPGFLTRRVTTNFSTTAGETVMLSGLVKNEMAKDVTKVPLLGQIPVLGELFKSRSFRENKTELAIFITPKEIREDGKSEVAAWQTKESQEQERMRFRIID
jgi:pilus assembly protein CpaC